jgi:hypothetical protein
LLASSQHNLYDIYHCCVYSARLLMMDSPKHVEFYSKNRFEELVHLVGFIIRVYHDARSSECQIRNVEFVYDLDVIRLMALPTVRYH